MKKLFNYIENLWLGVDKKPSLRASLAIAFSIDFISNLSHAIYKWDSGRSLEGLSLVLGIEAGLIVGLLGITAYSNISSQKIESQVGGLDNTVKIDNVEQVNLQNKSE